MEFKAKTTLGKWYLHILISYQPQGRPCGRQRSDLELEEPREIARWCLLSVLTCSGPTSPPQPRPLQHTHLAGRRFTRVGAAGIYLELSRT